MAQVIIEYEEYQEFLKWKDSLIPPITQTKAERLVEIINGYYNVCEGVHANPFRTYITDYSFEEKTQLKTLLNECGYKSRTEIIKNQLDFNEDIALIVTQ
jgi:hypothetical protein